MKPSRKSWVVTLIGGGIIGYLMPDMSSALLVGFLWGMLVSVVLEKDR